MKAQLNILGLPSCLISFCVFLIAICCLGCKDDDNGSITCAEELTFFITTNMMSFTLDELDDQGSRARLALNQSSFTNGNSLSRLLTIIGRSDDDTIILNLEVNVPDENSCIPEGIYTARNSDTDDGVVNMNYLSQSKIFSHDLDDSRAIIEITNCNLEEGIISGNNRLRKPC